MNAYLVIKTVHVITAAILFGTGLGIAFFMFRSHFTDDLHEKFYAIRTTVLADYLFTAPAAVLQPATGAWLIWDGGLAWNDAWLSATYVLYAIRRDVLAAGRRDPDSSHADRCGLPVIRQAVAG